MNVITVVTAVINDIILFFNHTNMSNNLLLITFAIHPYLLNTNVTSREVLRIYNVNLTH